jgi:xylulokinase
MATGAATLGIDIGTFESKAVLADAEGRILAQATVAHGLIVPRAGWAEHRADEDWWADLAQLSREVLAQSGLPAERVAALAVSAIGPCMLPVDAAGRPLMNAVLYGVDTRATAEIAELEARLGQAAILALGGNGLSSQSVGPKILWLQRNRPEIWDGTGQVHSATSWLVWRLTGAAVIDHYTAANFTPLYDIARQDWEADFSGLCRRDQLPRLMWSTEIAGRVTARAAAETGLAEGTPVTCGTIDAAAEAVSVGLRAPGDMMLMYGSTVFVILLAAERLADPRLWHAPWLWPGRHAAMAGLATSGTLTRWFRDELARDADFESLAAEAAASPPGARGLIVLPHFSGERTPLHDPGARGAVFGLDLTHRRGDLYRAVLEGIACATRAITDTYAEAGQRPERVRAVGGGTRNRVWLQATSDLTGLDQTLCRVTTGAAYGDAFLAALAARGAEPADIDRWNPPETVVTAATHPAHQRLYPLFRRLYRQTRDIAGELEAESDAL